MEPNLEREIKRLLKDIPKEEIPEAVDKIILKLVGLTEARKDYYIGVVVDYLKGIGVKLTRQSLRNDIKRAQEELPKKREKRKKSSDKEYPEISYALDFTDETGYVSVPQKIDRLSTTKGRMTTKKVKVFYFVTSNREFFEVDEQKLIDKKGLELRSQPPLSVQARSRWSRKYIDQFIKKGFEGKISAVFQETKAIYEFYLDFVEPQQSDVLALWTIGSYIFPIFETFPYISLTGPTGSGKTKVLKVAKKLCFNSILSPSISPAQLFRVVEDVSPTILIDEADYSRNPWQSQGLESLLKSGYEKGGEAVRCAPETFESQYFNLYSPKMLASIRLLEKVLGGRCIHFTMLRAKDTSEKGNRIVSETHRDWAYDRHMLYAFGLTYFKEIRNIYLDDIEIKNIEAVANRGGQLWQPLLCIAKFLDKNGCTGLYEEVKKVAVKKSKAAKLEGLYEKEKVLLLVLNEITSYCEIDIYNKEIKEKMLGQLEGESYPLTSRWIGKALDRFYLKEESRRTTGGEYCYTIRHQAVKDAIERYGVE